MPTLPELQLDYFAQALRGLADLARTTTNDHIKLRALLELARLCRPVPPTAARSGRCSKRRSSSSCDQTGLVAVEDNHTSAPLSRGASPREREGERATGLAPSPTLSIPSFSSTAVSSLPPRPSRSTSDIERQRRARMASQAREAIAINQSRGLPVPATWLAWARIDDSS